MSYVNEKQWFVFYEKILHKHKGFLNIQMCNIHLPIVEYLLQSKQSTKYMCGYRVVQTI